MRSLSGRVRNTFRQYGFAFLGGLLLCCGGCGSGSSSSPSTSPASAQALIVGNGAGTVLQAIQSQFQTVPGTGEEDPTSYAMIIFDGNNTTPMQLKANPGPGNFLRAGKAVVILNDTEDHLSTGLSGVVWAHAQGLLQPSPAVGFVLRHDKDGVAQQLVQIDFPVRVQAAPPSEQPLLPLIPTPAQLGQDSGTWLQQLIAMTMAPGNIDPAVVGMGQAVLDFDDVKPFTVTQDSVLNGQPAPFGTAWGPSGTQPPDFSTDGIGGTFETSLYAILEGNSPSTYQHKIIARQYLLVAPPNPLATSLATTQYAITGSNWNGTWPVYSTLGFNSDFQLTLQLLLDASTMGVTENLPEATNNVTQLTTSQSHTETVGLSVTSGVQNGNPLGTIGANWSDSWTWGQARTVSFQDWESKSTSEVSNNFVSYEFDAYGGSEVTAADLYQNILQLPPNNNQINSQFVAPFNYYPPSGQYPQFNNLQTSNMTNQSETVWSTGTGTLVPPQLVQLLSDAVIDSGEILELTSGTRDPIKPSPDSVFTGYGQTRLYQIFKLNFAAPGLQPPAEAPWTLSFGEFTQNPGSPYATVTGQVTLPQPAPGPGTTVNLTYVIQPQQQMLTLPATEACQGNTTSFNPGNSVINNGAPPFTITIPPGQTSATWPLTFQTFNSDTYNVQVVAWLTQATVDGQQVINPQSAWCLTPPNTLP